MSKTTMEKEGKQAGTNKYKITAENQSDGKRQLLDAGTFFCEGN